MNRTFGLSLGLFMCFALCGLRAQSADFSVDVSAGKVEFNRHVRPILSENCFSCHGPDEKARKANLRLDIREEALASHKGRRAIVPGDIGASELVKRITHVDPEERMPPVDSKGRLSEYQKRVLSRWIEEGAEYQLHWVYIPPKRPAIPVVESKSRSDNAIDPFILEKLETKGQQPSGPADPVTLIRRISFDLIGLPPTVEQVDGFVKDHSPGAYEKLVDRLLASEHYGERMAIHWLDLVRYADTVGYHGDQSVSVSPYRDYVIKAFNENMPYDQFTMEQLAGDLLEDATLEQKVASGYNRLNMMTREGGAQDKEYRAKYAADRVRTTSSVWLGVTMGCAECHDHKFDPFTMKDFYSFAAFFADVKGRGAWDAPGTSNTSGDWGTKVLVPTQAQRDQLSQIELETASWQKIHNTPTDSIAADQLRWEERILEEILKADPHKREDFAWIDDRQDNGGKTEGRWKFVAKAKGPVFSGKSSRLQSGLNVVQHHFHGAKRTITVGEGDVFFAYVWLDPEDPPRTVMLQFNDGSWEHRVFWGEDKIDFGGIGNQTAAHRPKGALPELGQWVRLEATPAEVGLKPGTVVNGMAFTQFDGKVWWDKAGVRTANSPTRFGHLPVELIEVLKIEAGQRTDEQKKELASYYRTIAPLLAGVRKELDALKQEKETLTKRITTSLVTVATEPRVMRILPRGNWLDDSGEVIAPATPVFLGRDREGTERLDRLDLARWLVRRENPMAARVFVNRLWKMFFGTGLSRVLDDLGGQGEWPSHPELLDWLAVEFMESGWDVKHMVKLMVSSATYRQSSRPTERLRQIDPYNRLLARQSRFRLPAEMIRDHALFVSGLLTVRVGGPSVKPYQPEGYYAHLNFPKRKYKHDSGANQYRRGLYTHWQRTFLHPSLWAFDAPSREECTAQRTISNTPLQALVLLNDPSYVEASRVFAERICRSGCETPEEKVSWAYKQALSRRPGSREAKVLAELYEKHLGQYTRDRESAKKLISTGESPVPSDIDTAELAAWTSVARVIFNLHGVKTRY